jgi:para-aminobenzoate synthetase component 1
VIKVAAPVMPAEEALLRCLRGERAFLLDGNCDVDGLGRYTIAGCDPDDGVVWRRGDAGDPVILLEEAQRRWSGGPVDEGPWPTAVGFLSYDLGEELVARPAGRHFSSRDELGLPLVDFARYPAVWRLDRARGRAEVLARDGAAAERLLGRLRREPIPVGAEVAAGAARWDLRDDDYRARVRRVLDYLRAGDCYQVNLAHRLRVALPEAGVVPLWLRLRAGAPAPLGAFLSIAGGEAAILSNTPELLLRVGADSDGRPARGAIETRPIKGTRRRGATAEEDAALAAELEASDKDAAEHVMIVDLERNDLGRVAQMGTVEVRGWRRRVTLPTVHHLVSTVAARLRPGVGLAEILRATFPGGSVTGAPKLRAMEIIDELEGVRRGVYCGAIGWLGPGQRAELALAIRTGTWTRASGELVWPVGGGIVADSDPDEELDETRVKAAAILRALGGGNF